MQPVSRKRQTIINVAVHYTSIALVIVHGIVLTPLYLRFMSEELYGAWLATGNLLSWIQLVDPGLSRIVQQRVASAYGGRNFEALPAILGTGLGLGTLAGCVPLAVIPLSGLVAGTLNLTPSDTAALTWALQLGLLGTSVMMISFQVTAATLGLQLSGSAGLIYIGAGLAGIGGTVALLYGGYGLAALPLGLLLRAGIYLFGNLALLIAWQTRHLRRRPCVTRDELRRYAALSSMTFIGRLGTMLLLHSEAYVGAKVLGSGVIAIYALTGRAYEPVRLAAERFGPAFLPGLAHLAGEGKMTRVTEIAGRLLNLVGYLGLVGAACVIALNSVFVSLWVGPDLFGGQMLTGLLGLSMAMGVVLSCWSEMVFAVGGIGHVEVMRAVEGVVKLGVQLACIWFWGLIGLPIGACLGMLLVSGWYLPKLAARLLQRSAGEEIRRWGGHLARCVVMVGLGLLGHEVVAGIFAEWTWPRFILVSIPVGLVYAAIGLALQPAVWREAQAVFARIRGWLRRPVQTAP